MVNKKKEKKRLKTIEAARLVQKKSFYRSVRETWLRVSSIPIGPEESDAIAIKEQTGGGALFKSYCKSDCILENV